MFKKIKNICSKIIINIKKIIKKIQDIYNKKYKPCIKRVCKHICTTMTNIIIKIKNVYNKEYKNNINNLCLYIVINIKKITKKIQNIYENKYKNGINNLFMYIVTNTKIIIKKIQDIYNSEYKDSVEALYAQTIINIINIFKKMQDIYENKLKIYIRKIITLLINFTQICKNRFKNLIIQIKKIVKIIKKFIEKIELFFNDNYYIFMQSNEFKVLVKYFNLLLDLIILIFLYLFNYFFFVQMFLNLSLKTKTKSNLFNITFISHFLYFTKIIYKIPKMNTFLKRKNLWIYTLFNRITLHGFKYFSFLGKFFSMRLKYNYYYLLTLNMLFNILVSWLEFFYPKLTQKYYDMFIISGTLVYIYSFIQACSMSYPIFPGLSEASRRFCQRSTHTTPEKK